MKKSELMSLFVLVLMAVMIIIFYFIEPIQLFKNFFLSLPILIYITISFMAYETLVEKIGLIKSNTISIVYYCFIVAWFLLLVFFASRYLDYSNFEILKSIVIFLMFMFFY